MRSLLVALTLLATVPLLAQVPGVPTNPRIGLTPPSGCTQTVNAGANLAAVITGAGNGATICLTSGSYGRVTLTSFVKSPRVTVRAVSALGASVAGLSVNGSPNGVTFDGITWSGDVGFNGTNSPRNITIQNSAFGVSQLTLDTSTYNLANIVFDHDTFGALNAGPNRSEGRVSVRNGGSNPSGVSITNSTFGPGGCSDGIQTGANRLVIGPGNLFTGIRQSGCTEHVDAIQGYMADNTQVIGNFFVNNTVAFGFYDGESGLTISGNVVNGAEVCDLGSITNLTLTHNTFRSVGCRIGGINFRTGGSGLVTNNLWHGGGISQGSPAFGGTITHNMFSSGGTGTNNIIGTPTYTGGSAPATWPGWLLAPGSIGKGAASDGGDMGATTFGP